MGPDAHRHSPLPRRLRGRHAARLGHMRALQDADAEGVIAGIFKAGLDRIAAMNP